MIAGLVSDARKVAPITLLGGVAHGNDASARILRKLGFVKDTRQSLGDVDMFALTLT